MPYFKDAQEVYDHLGRLIADATADDALGPRFGSASTILRYRHTDPDSTITVRLQDDQPGEVELGPTEDEGEVTIAMSADVAHRYWLGEVNLAAALTRGELEARGPVDKLLELVPLGKRVSERYRRQLADQGREDLLET